MCLNLGNESKKYMLNIFVCVREVMFVCSMYVFMYKIY